MRMSGPIGTAILRWLPEDASRKELFARLHDELAADAWLASRARNTPGWLVFPDRADEVWPREAWFAGRDARAYGIVLDAHGKVAWGRCEIDGDAAVVVLRRKRLGRRSGGVTESCDRIPSAGGWRGLARQSP